MKVIAISGKAQHGKDTTARFLKADLEMKGYRVLITHYADLLKYLCRSFFQWNGEKDEAGRRLLQYVGTDVVRRKQPDFWVDFLAGVLTMFSDEWNYVLIPDCRFPNEIDGLIKAGLDTTHLRVFRENFESPLTPEQQRHPSETALDGYIPDAYIWNDGTLAALDETVRNWLDHFMR